MAQLIAIGIVQSGDMILIGRRESDTALAGYDEFPGGKVEPHESPEQAVIRECLEETGIAVVVKKQFATIDHSYDHGDLRLHFFLCRPASDIRHVATGNFRWVSRTSLADCHFPTANAEVVKSLLNDSPTATDC